MAKRVDRNRGRRREADRKSETKKKERERESFIYIYDRLVRGRCLLICNEDHAMPFSMMSFTVTFLPPILDKFVTSSSASITVTTSNVLLDKCEHDSMFPN